MGATATGTNGQGFYRTGLEIINSTNLDYFGPPQKAEFFQLKALFLEKMGFNEDANVAYSTSVSIYDSLAKVKTHP